MPNKVSTENQTTPNPLQVVCVITICFGWFIYASIASVGANIESSSEGFSNETFIRLILTELVFASIALVALRSWSYPISSLAPIPSTRGSLTGIMLYVLCVVVSLLAIAPFKAEQSVQPIQSLMSHATPTLPYIILLAIVNASYEEIFLLAYIVRGYHRYSRSFAIGLSLLVRLLYHIYQGPLGVMSVVGFGLVVSIFYVKTKQLWPAVVAHILGDIVPFL